MLNLRAQMSLLTILHSRAVSRITILYNRRHSRLRITVLVAEFSETSSPFFPFRRRGLWYCHTRLSGRFFCADSASVGRRATTFSFYYPSAIYSLILVVLAVLQCSTTHVHGQVRRHGPILGSVPLHPPV
jgi:hypothetical protein